MSVVLCVLLGLVHGAKTPARLTRMAHFLHRQRQPQGWHANMGAALLHLKQTGSLASCDSRCGVLMSVGIPLTRTPLLDRWSSHFGRHYRSTCTYARVSACAFGGLVNELLCCPGEGAPVAHRQGLVSDVRRGGCVILQLWRLAVS